MLDRLYNFTPIIQLIAGVNFAFILGDFIEKAYKHIFDPQDLIDDMDENSRNIISIDMGSLNAMEPIETKDGKSNRKDLESLKAKYVNLNNDWNNICERSKNYVCRVGQNKGFKLLFLLSSLYSIIVLLVTCYRHSGVYQLDGLINVSVIKISYALFVIINIILCLVLSIRVFYCKAFDKPKEFVSLIKWVIIALLVSFVVGVIFDNSDFSYGSELNNVLNIILFASSILLPFLALLLSVGYMIFCRTIVQVHLWFDNKIIKAKLIWFRRDKKRIKNYYESFTNDIEFS